LNSENSTEVERIIKSIRINYVSLSHGLIYIALVLFPLLLHFIPKYQETLTALNLIALALTLYTNSFGYNSYLMARNQERTIALISVLALLLNILTGLLLVHFFRIDYPEIDPPEWSKFITIKLENGELKTGELPLKYWGDMKTNYEAHNRDYDGVYTSK